MPQILKAQYGTNAATAKNIIHIYLPLHQANTEDHLAQLIRLYQAFNWERSLRKPQK